MPKIPNRKGKGLRDYHASFTPDVADFIDTLASTQDLAKSVIISGLVRAGIKAIYQGEEHQDPIAQTEGFHLPFGAMFESGEGELFMCLGSLDDANEEGIDAVLERAVKVNYERKRRPSMDERIHNIEQEELLEGL